MRNTCLRTFRGAMAWCKALPLALLMFCASTNGVDAYPPPIPLEDRLKQSQLVIVADITNVSSRKHTAKSKIVSLRVKVLETLKGKVKPKEFTLTFLAFPETEESHIIRAPGKGRYIFFLNYKKVKDSQGRVGQTIVFYEPRVYAYVTADDKNLSAIKLLVQ